MTLTLTSLISLSGLQARNGRHAIDQSFTGNRLAVNLRIAPNLDRVNTIIGVITQHYQGARADYQIRASQSVLTLHLPQTDFLSFFPISSLYDEYGLDLAYTTVGDTVSESSIVVLPENLAVLPDKVADLEALTTVHGSRLDGIDLSILELGLLPTSVSWESITDKPTSFNPSTHSHTISDISGLEGLTNNGNITTTLLTANSALESNKQYFSTVANLVCALPSSPSIGDVIHLSTGNHSLRVNHGNASQQVLNGNTLTVVGTLNGIILKPYADISLVFLGSNLWRTGYRIRTVNNWVDSFTETVASIKSYTVEALEAYTYNASGNNPSFIVDGNKTTSGLMRSGGGTLGELRLRLTFPYPTLLTSFNYWLGQFNGAFNMPTSVDVYTGATVTPANLKGAISLSGSTGTRNITNSEYASQYVFNFKLANSGSISVLELETVGTQIISGEIVVS
ncbi:MAG: hypothetical protein ACK5RE_18025 [Pseudanabaena sp.]|jgi:hypothetical protein